MAKTFGFRITPGDKNCEHELQLFLKKYCQSWVVTVEYGDRLNKLHYQAWAVTECNRKNFQQNLRNYVKNCCESFSCNLEECRDFEAMQRYVMKGSKKGEMPVILYSYGIAQFGEDYIRKYHEAYWEENAKYKKAFKDKKATMFSEMSGYIESLSGPPTKRQLADKYVQICHELDKPIDEYRAKAFLRLMYSKYNDEGRNEVVDKLSDF